MSRNKMGYGGYVPGRAWRDTDLTSLDHRLLEYIAQHDRGRANGMGCYRTHRQMAADVRADRTSVTTRLPILVQRGYLGCEPSKEDKRRTIYWVIYMDELDNPYPKKNVPAREHNSANNVLASQKECSPEKHQVTDLERETPVQDRNKISGETYKRSCETEPPTNLENISCETARLLGNEAGANGKSPAFKATLEQWQRRLRFQWKVHDPVTWVANRIDRIERQQTLGEAQALDYLNASLDDARSETARQLYNDEISRWSDFPLDEWLEELEGHKDHD